MTGDFLKLATTGVYGLQPYQPGKPLSELAREYGIYDAVKLASNENPLGPSPLAIAAIHNNLHDIARYPDGNGFELKQALATKYGIAQNMITLGNGSNDILELIARAYVTPAHTVIFSEHAFAVYPLVTQAIGASARVTPAKNWGYDLTAIQAAICEHTRLIFIANPNNPTGTWVNNAELQAFLKAVPENVLVVLDEAYCEYVDHPGYPNGLEWQAQYPNVIVTRTFSKAYGLAGLRVGYAISHPDIANILNRVRQPFNVNSLALVAATAAMADSAYLQEVKAANQKGMQQLTSAFTAMKLAFIPSVANFVTVAVGDGAKVYELLLRQGMITRPVGNYGLPHHLRITVGLPEENERLIRALHQQLPLLG